MSLSPASLLSRRSFFARFHVTRPFKSRRTFDSFWQVIVRDSPARHLHTPSVHLALNQQYEQSSPFPPPQLHHPSETVKICQNRASGDYHQILSHQNSPPLTTTLPAHQLTPGTHPHRLSLIKPQTSTQPLRRCRYIFTSAHLHRPASNSERPNSSHPRHTAKPERSSTSCASSSGTRKATLTHPLSRPLHL